MSTLKLAGFSGEVPRIIPRLLQGMLGQNAYNTKLDDGGLTPVRKKRFEQQLAAPPVGVYGTIYKNGADWMAWTGNVYATPGPVATDRLYVMGDGAPKMIVAGDTYPLAVPAPGVGLTASIVGAPTSDLGSTRLYVFTWVTDFGEESEPSLASNEIYWKPGQTVELTGFPAVPTGRNITKQRIYRAQTSLTGTQLYFIDERVASVDVYTDIVAPESLQEPLPSADWNAPPSDLTGLSSGPNGMMAAFRGKQVYFCEPFRPHAWPEKYVLTADYEIVGLGWFGSSLAILTKGSPCIATGTAPENMVMEKPEINLPCINPRGVVDLGYSIAYPSYDGLVTISSAGPQVVSVNLFTRDDWMRMNPQSMTAGQYNGRYFASYNYADSNNQEFRGSVIIDLTGQQSFLIRSKTRADAMYYDMPNGQLFMLVDNSIYEWDAVSEPFELQSWKSKIFVLPTPTNFGACLVEADNGLTPDQVAAIEAEILRIIDENSAIFTVDGVGGEMNDVEIGIFEVNGDNLQSLPRVSREVSVSIYADRKLVATVGKVNSAVRLPGGFKAALWEVEVSSDMPISQISLATTMKELATI